MARMMVARHNPAMTKAILWLVSGLLLSVGCASAPEDDDVSAAAELRKKPSTPTLSPTTSSDDVEVKVSAATLGRSGASVWLDWPELWRRTKLSHAPRLWFEVPERDGDLCDDACVAAVQSRAAARGGALKGKLTVDRRFGDLHRPNGTCVRVLQETVTLDLRHATHGIAPQLESTYGFLTFTDALVPSVELFDIPCP